jgi:hypothetical protein
VVELWSFPSSSSVHFDADCLTSFAFTLPLQPNNTLLYLYTTTTINTMATTLFRTSAMRSAVRAAPSMRASIGGTTFVRGKATLPDLACLSRLIAYACLLAPDIELT